MALKEITKNIIGQLELTAKVACLDGSNQVLTTPSESRN